MDLCKEEVESGRQQWGTVLRETPGQFCAVESVLVLILFLRFCIIFMCISAFPVCLQVHHMHAWCSWTSEGARCPETGVIHGCEPPCRCWGLSQSPLHKQPVLLTAGPSCCSSSSLLSMLALGKRWLTAAVEEMYLGYADGGKYL